MEHVILNFNMSHNFFLICDSARPRIRPRLEAKISGLGLGLEGLGLGLGLEGPGLVNITGGRDELTQ